MPFETPPPSPPALPPGLPALVARLARALAPERIILFGSYPRGTARAGSDIDLLVIGDWGADLAPPRRQARHLVARSFPRVDIVLCTQGDLRDGSAEASFLAAALESGTVVYCRQLRTEEATSDAVGSGRQ